MIIDDMDRWKAIWLEYVPYCMFPEFQEGVEAHGQPNVRNPHDGVDGQAWDRGLEAAARYMRGDDPRSAPPDPESYAGLLQRIADTGE